ncbi:hypothetical protein SCAR479_00184 [Seiridium cardinale]|uniref:Uncharacterized protein n=1 Tax=Seiridium cardinale TaxID=138064 RepID=A0ABR2Y8Z0_9PEZI
MQPGRRFLQPVQARQNYTGPEFGTCNFDRAPAFKTLTVSNPPCAKKKKRACGSKSQPEISSSNVPSVAATNRRAKPSASSASGLNFSYGVTCRTIVGMASWILAVAALGCHTDSPSAARDRAY